MRSPNDCSNLRPKESRKPSPSAPKRLEEKLTLKKGVRRGTVWKVCKVFHIRIEKKSTGSVRTSVDIQVIYC